MRTDGSTEGPDPAAESGAEDRSPDLSLSRRRFVLASGVTATPLVSGPGAASRVGRRAVVGATPPYRPAVDSLARDFERSTESSVELRRTSAEPGRVLDEDLDVLVTGRPPSGSDFPGEYGVGVAVHGSSTLARPDDAWRECLSRRTIRERMASETPVETWSETDWASARLARERGDATTGCTQQSTAAADATALVRGTRSYQYARGRGGVGYYEVASDDIHRKGGTRAEDAGSAVPLLRVGYVYADGEARDSERVGRFLRFYGDRAVTTADGVEHFAGRPSAESGRPLWA